MLQNCKLDDDGELSYSDRSLKLDSSESARIVTDGLRSCACLTTFNLNGNTIGVEAAIEIGKGLEKHPEFKNAIWKNMFTGRLKEEIPLALRYMCNGVIIANAKLAVLDLSDNAFGPIGVEGLNQIFSSECCFTLKQLILNNNGLGIDGAKMLAESLTKCYQKSNGQFTLNTFIAGRNRLENAGAIALANVFKMMKSLRIICVPQNGIYYRGVKALCDAFMNNPNLTEINLNDNTLNVNGAELLSKILPSLKYLEILNIGDCLIKTKGAYEIALGIKKSSDNIKTLILDENEIKLSGILQIVKSVADKSKLESVSLSGNSFGPHGVRSTFELLKRNGQEGILHINSEDEEDASGSSDDEENASGSSDDGETDHEIEKDTDESTGSDDSAAELGQKEIKESDAEEEYSTENGADLQQKNALKIADVLSVENFKNMGSDYLNLFEEYISMHIKPTYHEEVVRTLVKISNLCDDADENVSSTATNVCLHFYKFVFNSLNEYDTTNFVNHLLAQLQLIKAEDGEKLATLNKQAVLIPLEKALHLNYIPEREANIIRFVMNRKK